MTRRKYNQVLLALGSNVAGQKDSPVGNLSLAIAELGHQGVDIKQKSGFYATPCFPAGAGPDFANAALHFATDLPPLQILKLCHDIEARAGRERTRRWGARILDLDLLAVDDSILPDRQMFEHWATLPLDAQMQQAPDRLILPHPRLHERAFVLVPLMDIAPDWVHPVYGRSIAQMHAALPPEALAEIRRIDV